MCLGQTHGAPYSGYGYVPLRFGGGGGGGVENFVRRIGTQHRVSSFSKLF